jgi:predicted nucleic-acid-binding Zn-ribbon protein
MTPSLPIPILLRSTSCKKKLNSAVKASDKRYRRYIVMSRPKCPACGSVDFEINSIGFPPMKTADGKERQFIPKNFICCEKCGTIISEYNSDGEILKMLDVINNNILKIEVNTYPVRSR